jgi:hypothetical protein
VLLRSLALLGPLVLLVLGGLAPAASAAPLVTTAVAGQAAGVPGPEVIDRSTITPILLGTGCSATEVVLPLAGPVTWWLVTGGSTVTIDASQPYGIDPAATTQVRAILSRGARFDDGSTEADWRIGPGPADVVTGCVPAPPSTSTTTAAPKPAPTSTTAPAPTRAPQPTSTAPVDPTGGDDDGGSAAVTSGGRATTSDAGTPGSDAGGPDGLAAGRGGPTSSGSAGGADGPTTTEASQEPVVLAAPEVETRVLSNSFTRPEVSATAAAVAGPTGDGASRAVAPLAGVVALLAASGLVAGLLLYRGARGGARPTTPDGAAPLA